MPAQSLNFVPSCLWADDGRRESQRILTYDHVRAEHSHAANSAVKNNLGCPIRLPSDDVIARLFEFRNMVAAGKHLCFLLGRCFKQGQDFISQNRLVSVLALFCKLTNLGKLLGGEGGLLGRQLVSVFLKL